MSVEEEKENSPKTEDSKTLSKEQASVRGESGVCEPITFGTTKNISIQTRIKAQNKSEIGPKTKFARIKNKDESKSVISKLLGPKNDFRKTH